MILDETDLCGRRLIEQGRISKECFDGLREFLLEQQDLLEKRTSKPVSATAVVFDIDDDPTDGAFFWGCLTYALLWMETNGKLKDAARGDKVLQAARKGHAAVHGTKEEKQARRAAHRAAFDEVRVNHPCRSKEWICAHLAKRFGVCSKTIKRHVQK